MKLSEQFTEEQIAALEVLEKAFGSREVSVKDIRANISYGDYADAYIQSALSYLAYQKLAETIDFAEIKRLRDEEARKKLADRADEVRSNIVFGILSSFASKLNKTFPEGFISFETDEESIFLSCHAKGDGLGAKKIVELGYNKETYALVTIVEGVEYINDATSVDGHISPQGQFTGIQALVDFLGGQSNG